MKHESISRKQESISNETYLTLKTNIQLLSLINKMKIFLITSPNARDGKSTVSVNLAKSFASSNKKVLLIDCNFLNPTLHKLFNLSNINGISDVLLGKIALLDCLQSTDINNLYLLPSGSILDNTGELFFNDPIDNYIDIIKNTFDFIIIDSPPILNVGYTQLLSNIADGTILVVSYGKTDKNSIIKAKNILVASNSRIIGSVLNKAPYC